MSIKHPSDDIANNLDTLFVSPNTSSLSPDRQTRINEIVAAARACADQYIMTIPMDSVDRQDALAMLRKSFERAVVAIMTEPVTVGNTPPDPVTL